MKPASVSDIKKELSNHDPKEILEYCLRLVKFKKENKEMLSFLLFEEDDIPGFIASVKNDTEEQFLQMNKSNIYFMKKSVRKILRNINKHIRFAASKQVEAELLIHFCNCFVTHSIPIEKSRQLLNLYQNQLKKIEKSLASLHPDLQYDMQRQLIR
ncbi:MAG: hypothetical protein ABI366_01515 [Ginsengibacter sp.]